MRRAQINSAMLWLPGLVLLASLTLASQVISPPTSEIKSSELDLILHGVEDMQRQDPTQSRPYEVTRGYKVFHGYDEHPTSEITAKITFTPPDRKTYQLVEKRGSSWGAKIVCELLDSETESARKENHTEVSRANYDFVFLRRQNFGVIPEYVFAIFPKRKDKFLLRGQIWVDASSLRIRRIEGVPAKSPSFWLKNLHITLQFAELGGMWVPVAFDGIADVRFFGDYTLAGLNRGDGTK